jgi:superfamily I DNA/RNA helicase
MPDRWQPSRARAALERTLAQTLTPATGVGLAHAALEGAGLDVFALPPGDPLLGGARALFDGEYVAYDSTLPTPAAAFSLAHELGHRCLHGAGAACSSEDINEEWATERPPGGVVEVYNPRAQQELEANVFAAAFLMPLDELRPRLLGGARLSDLAAHYGVSETAMATALAGVLFGPTAPAAAQAPTPHPQPPAIRRDPSQEAAATVAAGPVLVDAGPGTGKTRTLVERVLYLLRRGVAARNILALTFSNRAAAEMRERLTLAAPAQASGVTIGTFHAFCLQLLRDYGPAVGLPVPALIQPLDAAVLLEQHLDDLGLEHYFNLHNPGYWLRDILGAISRAKDELVGPERYLELAQAARAAAPPDDEKAQKAAAKWLEVARVYAVYERLLRERGLQDFGGLLGAAVHLLRDHPDLRAHIQQTYTQILVDEYQDMNRASGVLLQLLAGEGRGLWVVGDLRQAIYRFRGASPANIAQFSHDFPGGQRLSLGVNYRSDGQLVSLFRTVGAAMPLPNAPPADWQPARTEAAAPRIWLAQASDERAEARGIAAAIQERHAAGRPYREQVILCRAHRQAEPIARELERQGIPVLYLGPLCERPEVRDLLALLSLAAEGGSGFLRVGAMADHYLPRAERIRLLQYADKEDLSFPAALRQAEAAGLAPESVAACVALADTLDAISYSPNAWHFLVRYLFGHSTIPARLLADPGAAAAQQRLAIGRLLGLAREWAGRAPADDAPPPLAGFLAHIRRLVANKEDTTALPPESDDLDAVRVLTVHASKGLEFPVVYLPNLADRRFPAREQYDAVPPLPGLFDGEAGDRLVEETCLFFVALSRARDELVLSVAERYGKLKYPPSPLLDLVTPFFTGVQPILLTWDDGAPDAGEPEAGAADPAPLDHPLEMSEIELYLRCPRRYEYNRVIGLAEPGGNSGYRHFHACLQRTLAHLRQLHRSGTLPPTAPAAVALLEADWDEHGPCDHIHAPLYARIAAAMVTRYWAQLQAGEAAAPWHEEMTTEIDGVPVRIKVDAAEELPDGSLRLVRHRLGRPRDDDGRAERLAVLRRTVAERVPREREVRIELEYLGSGETVPVKAGGRYEEARLRKVEEAVRGIRARRFPAAPAADDDCRTCPYWMINPA